MPISLSKSDFQEAQGCPKRLIYKKAHYPSTKDENEFLKVLSQGGYAVGKMATLYFEGGIEIEGEREDCILRTQELLQEDHRVLFEAAFRSAQKEVRVDILVKDERKIHLIEVKSKGMDGSRGFDAKLFSELLDDVAFQFLVVSELYPDFEICCSLMMPDKSKRCGIDALPSWFPLMAGAVPALPGGFSKPEVRFRFEGDPQRNRYIAQLQSQGIMRLTDVTTEVLERLPAIREQAERYLRILRNGIQPGDFRLGRHCKACAYRTPGSTLDGFAECWGAVAYPEHHMFELYHGTNLRHPEGGFYLDKLLERGSSSMLDVEEGHLTGKDGAVARRQLIQLVHTRDKTEWRSPGLAEVIRQLRYPLHFIDFETYSGALPFHKGMRPYEWIAFQWSCHTIDAPGSAPRHSEWIHTGEGLPEHATFPNFEFARSLMRQVGENGTLVRWAKHERTILRMILGQMEAFGVDDRELKAWLTKMSTDDSGNWLDMQEMALLHYFHPDMKGSTSIKKVLPAVWNAYPELHKVQQFKDYAPDEFAQGFHDPYDVLRRAVPGELEDDEDVVDGGTQAMMAYARIRFDESLNEEDRAEVRRRLLNYCKLDTMAMVIIFEAWKLTTR